MVMKCSRVTPVAVLATTVFWVYSLSDSPSHAMGLGDIGTDPPVAFVSEVVQSIGRFESPSRIALHDDMLYVADTARGHVAIFDSGGVRSGTITEVSAPLGLAATTRRNRVVLYVGDIANGSVQIFEDGQPAGFLGAGSGEFLMPNAIAVHDKRVYVVDSGAGIVRFFNHKGDLKGSFGTTGSGEDQFGFPSDIAVDAETGLIYVSDWGNRRISVWDRDGNWSHNIATPPNDHGVAIFLRPSGLGIDAASRLYVVDNALSCVVVMDRSGVLVDVFGYQASQYHTGELQIPVDVASDGHRVYVTSSADGRVHVFEVTP
jgi:DNA-binding beta-propeller fold protein YncE